MENNNVTVYVTLSANNGEIIFTDFISSTSDHVRSYYESYDHDEIDVLYGKVEGRNGCDLFDSFDHLFSILDVYDNCSISRSL